MSTNQPAYQRRSFDGSPCYDWRGAGLRYYAYNFHLRSKFGQRVQRVSLNGGFTCPNVDGTVATGGCNFCDNRSFSPSRRVRRREILEQLDDGIRRIKLRYKADRFLAYFQPATNTYAPPERLRPLYEAALSHPQVLGLAIGTRPDCLSEPVLALLEELAAETYLSLEIGVQTIHDRSLKWMNRGHGFAEFIDAAERSRGRGFELATHVILGLPGESRDDMLATADAIADLGFDAVKIHNLYVVKGTPLADEYAAGKVRLLDRDEYIELVIDFIERLPPNMVVERTTGEAPPDYFVGPAWCLDKPAYKHALEAAMQRRDAVQGAKRRKATENQEPKAASEATQ